MPDSEGDRGEEKQSCDAEGQVNQVRLAVDLAAA